MTDQSRPLVTSLNMNLRHWEALRPRPERRRYSWGSSQCRSVGGASGWSVRNTSSHWVVPLFPPCLQRDVSSITKRRIDCRSGAKRRKRSNQANSSLSTVLNRPEDKYSYDSGLSTCNHLLFFNVYFCLFDGLSRVGQYLIYVPRDVQCRRCNLSVSKGTHKGRYTSAGTQVWLNNLLLYSIYRTWIFLYRPADTSEFDRMIAMWGVTNIYTFMRVRKD